MGGLLLTAVATGLAETDPFAPGLLFRVSSLPVLASTFGLAVALLGLVSGLVALDFGLGFAGIKSSFVGGTATVFGEGVLDGSLALVSLVIGAEDGFWAGLVLDVCLLLAELTAGFVGRDFLAAGAVGFDFAVRDLLGFWGWLTLGCDGFATTLAFEAADLPFVSTFFKVITSDTLLVGQQHLMGAYCYYLDLGKQLLEKHFVGEKAIGHNIKPPTRF